MCALLMGCGAQQRAPATTTTPSTASTQPAFGSLHDEEHAPGLAMAVIQTRAKRNHPHARFLVVTEADWQTATHYYVKAQGYLIPPARPPLRALNHESMLVLELRPHHRLVVASYKERQVHVPLPQEAP
jgi:hypothetical protein